MSVCLCISNLISKFFFIRFTTKAPRIFYNFQIYNRCRPSHLQGTGITKIGKHTLLTMSSPNRVPILTTCDLSRFSRTKGSTLSMPSIPPVAFSPNRFTISVRTHLRHTSAASSTWWGRFENGRLKCQHNSNVNTPNVRCQEVFQG